MASKQQLTRLNNEYEALVKGLEGNPFIHIVRVKGDPPFRYTIGYNLKSVAFDPTSREISHVEKQEVTITLYKDYPKSAPYIELKEEIFHPNISPTEKSVNLKKFWTPEKTLLEVVRNTGAILCYQEYDLTLPIDKDAAEWAMENESSLPLDEADLHSHEEAEAVRDQDLAAEPKTVCTYCHKPDPKSQCSNGHDVCSECESKCEYCPNVTCLACPDNTCRQCLEKIRKFRLEMAEKVKAGDVKSAIAIGVVALKSFRNSRQLRNTIDKLRNVKEIVEDTAEFRRMKCFVGIAKACDELRTLGFYNEMTAKLEAEASEMLRASDDLVAQGKESLQIEHDPELASTYFTDALGIVADHPGASDLIKEARRQVDEGKKQIEMAREYLAKSQFEPAIRAASKAAALDISLHGEAQELIQKAQKFQAVEPGRKKEQRIRLATLMVAPLLLVATGFLLWHNLQIEDKYAMLIEQVEKEQSLEGKIQRLKDFAGAHKLHGLAKDAEDRIWNLKRLIRERDFEATIREAESFVGKKDYESAEAAYETYLAKYPKTIYTNELHTRLLAVLDLIDKRDDERDYQALRALSGRDCGDRIHKYNSYLASYPKGKHREAVKQLSVKAWKQCASHLRRKIKTGIGEQDWDYCVDMCDTFGKHLKAPVWSKDIESLKAECRKRSHDEKDLYALIAEADAQGEDYDTAKQIYLTYLEENPDSSQKETIRKRIAALRERIADRQDWEGVLAYVEAEKNDFHKRIERLKKYMGRKPPGEHVQEAEQKIRGLENEHDVALWAKTVECSENPEIDTERRITCLENFLKRNMSGKYLGNAEAELRMLRDEQQRVLWHEIVRYCDMPTVPVSQKISRIEGFIAQFPSGDDVRDARAALKKVRILQAEENRIRRRIAATGSAYSYSNGIIRDKRTGLMWCAFDSSLELNHCLPYKSAVEYVRRLRYGGYSDWRLPSMAELRLILKRQPFFPTTMDGEWYWSSDQLGERIVPVMTSKRETAWNVAEIESRVGCGTVRAVRGP